MQQHVLIISNEPTLYNALVRLNPNYTLSYTNTIEECIENIKTLSKTHLLGVILDTQFKECSTIDLLKKLYLQVISAKYIILDYKEDINTAVEAYQQGACLYIKKPNKESLEQFSQTIQNLFNESVTQKQLNDAFLWDNIYSRSHLKDMQYLLELTTQQNLEKHLKSHQVSNTTPQLLDELCTSNSLTLPKLEDALNTIKQKLQTHIKKPLLLIIEDEPLNQNLANKQLYNMFELLPALNGNEALDLVNKHPSIRLIILDIYLPDIQGEALYKQIRAINKQASVIVFTAYEENDIAKSLIQQGAYEYINKPYKKDHLVQKLYKSWLRQCWPFFEGKLNIQTLDYLHRAIFFDYLIKKRLEKQEPLYELDYLALFPELLDIKVSQ